MKNIIIGFIIGFITASSIVVFADPSFIGSNSIWNNVFNSGTNTITVSFP